MKLLMISTKNKNIPWIKPVLFSLTMMFPSNVQSGEIKYLILWSSNSPRGPIGGVARNFEKYTFDNLEDCQAQIAKELFDDESYGSWEMMKSYFGDTTRIGARLREAADQNGSRTLYICDTLQPYPE
ncbi:hypothetical protein IMCC1909_19650 [Rhodobacteraceae bacterium IMCC1909]|nr:hypothetical protein [Rhodobacteraceae bacterium IMCC1909]